MSWTDERVEILKRMWLDDHASASEIAKKLKGVTRSAVLGKVHRLGLCGVRPEEVSAANVRRLMPRSEQKPKREPRMTRPRKPIARRPVNNPLGLNGTKRSARKAPTFEPPPLVFDASKAKPWTERKFGECAYPISGEGADTHSCCQPTKGTYCKPHASVMYWRPATPLPKLERLARRYA